MAISDVNLKFNKPEVNVTIDREKAESLEFQLLILLKITQLSGQRFGYLCKMVSNISGYWAI
jgi:HAE1 family hydrophobic/amphiphilic exporter-1/multidrug efflux pump